MKTLSCVRALVLCAVLLSCVNERASTGVADWPNGEASPLAVSEYDFSFGTVQYQRGIGLAHTFRIQNRSDTQVQLRLSDWSACCLTPKLDRAVIEPGQSAELAVTFRLNRDSGFLAGACTILSDSRPEELRFTVTASVYPIARITTPEGNCPAPLAIHAGETASLHGLLVAFSDSLHDTPELRTNSEDLRVECVGRPTERVGEGGIEERLWPVELSIRAGAAIGPCQATIEVVGPDGPVAQQVISWNVQPVLVARPGFLVVRNEESLPMTTEANICSVDSVAFRILKISCPDDAVRGIGCDDEAVTAHKVQISLARSESGARTTSLIIETDRNDQPTVRIPVVFLDSTSETTKGAHEMESPR